FKYLIENNIIIYKIPESWIYSTGGLNETFAEILKLEIEGIFQIKIGDNFLPYGRICSPFKSQIRYSLFLNIISDKLGLKNFQYLLVNDIEDIVQKCILLVGKKANPKWLKRAKIKGINLFLGNGLNYSLAHLAESLEINFIDLTYNSIFVGLSRLSQILSIKIPEIEFIEVKSPVSLSFFSR
ncbi:MAG: Nif3-like dinuclear metal center hexameric protein, partial [Candidatus Hodarchaeota archaeon]